MEYFFVMLVFFKYIFYRQILRVSGFLLLGFLKGFSSLCTWVYIYKCVLYTRIKICNSLMCLGSSVVYIIICILNIYNIIRLYEGGLVYSLSLIFWVRLGLIVYTYIQVCISDYGLGICRVQQGLRVRLLVGWQIKGFGEFRVFRGFVFYT